VHVSVVRPDQLGPAEGALWANFQELSPITLNPFFSFTFTQIVGRARPNARVAVVEEDGQIAAFLPYEIHSNNIGMPIGWPMNNLHGFIGSGTAFDPRSVVRAAGLRGWRFQAAPQQQGVLVPYHYPETAVQCQVISLADGYKSYVESLSRSLVTKTTRKRRNLERVAGPLSYKWCSPGLKYLPQLIDWESSRHYGVQRLLSDSSALRIVEDVTMSENRDCAGRLSGVFADELPIALLLGIMGPQALCGWFCAFDASLSRFSPGTIMWLSLAEHAGNQGVTRIDLGAGQDPYKFKLANASYGVGGGAVWASRAETLIRAAYRRIIQRSKRRAQMRIRAGS